MLATDQTEVQEYRIDVPQDDCFDLCRRLEATRWPDELPNVGWSHGVPAEFLQEMAHYWRRDYDWRAHESRLNALPQFTTVIDDQLIHFAHARSSQPGATALLLTHGWPSTFADFADLVGPLTSPDTHDATGAPAFHVIAPSLPGFGFSGPTRRRGWNVARIGEAWAELMRRLGYGHYLVAGGDFGSVISPAVGRAAPSAVMGVHVNAMLNGADVDPSCDNPTVGLSKNDIVAASIHAAHWAQRGAYADPLCQARVRR